ncbi:MAG: hypothetical protein K2W86_08745 [Sphingomonas sp.]|uniref:hypothetical protein n=1 Tax=Sphingomonas sp. TaxID=28214 RepID=UPI0035A99598|nr:hypothetical protein [Sphingomonas sp.]
MLGRSSITTGPIRQQPQPTGRQPGHHADDLSIHRLQRHSSFDSGAPLYTGYLIGKQSLLFALTVLIVVIGVGAPWMAFALLFGWLYRISGLRALRRRWKDAAQA